MRSKFLLTALSLLLLALNASAYYSSGYTSYATPYGYYYERYSPYDYYSVDRWDGYVHSQYYAPDGRYYSYYGPSYYGYYPYYYNTYYYYPPAVYYYSPYYSYYDYSAYYYSPGFSFGVAW